jgi:hypothetical protein
MMTMTTTQTDDALDKRAQAILEITRQCWKLLSDLRIDDRAVALDKLDEWLTLEALTHIPEAAPGRAH